MMNKNKVVIAAAGSGKTTMLVEEALKATKGRVLITTFTTANEAEIKKKIIELNKSIPPHITVQTWFSLLLMHGVRPMQSMMFPQLHDKKDKGLILVNGQSVPGTKESYQNHYFTNDLEIYSDKIAKFVVKCNEKSGGYLINRLSRIYSDVYIDEVQDMAGYDLEIIKLIAQSKANMLLVGDPRQGTYVTNNSNKNRKFKSYFIGDFFNEYPNLFEKDETSFRTNYRCNKMICNLSNKLYPNDIQTISGNNEVTGHDGVFFVAKKDIDRYLYKYSPVQLRETRRTKVNDNYKAINFGNSKGLSFDRTLIYPTKPIIEWIKNSSKELAQQSRAKLYVALTRARYSVAIVNDQEGINEDIKHYIF